MKTVYIETTIPSFFHEIRQEPEMIARRNWTQQWWNEQRDKFRGYISEAVIEELNDGDYPIKDAVINLIEDIDILNMHDNIEKPTSKTA